MIDLMRRGLGGTRLGWVVLLVSVLSPVPVTSAAEPLVVFLVRHAEKVNASADPELSAPGKVRARQLADSLRDAGIKHIHSSDFIRTRETAKPLADKLKQPVQIYNRRNLPTLVTKLKRTGGRHLVVGHSTTTPIMVKLLGGQPGSAIQEASEFDRLYVVTLDGDSVTTLLLRYGKPFESRGGR